jgi:hypothetical protein
LPVLLLLAFGNADAAIRDAATRPARRSARLALAAAIGLTCWATAVSWLRSETIARNGAAAAVAVARAGPRIIVTRRAWESQLLAPVPPSGGIAPPGTCTAGELTEVGFRTSRRRLRRSPPARS